MKRIPLKFYTLIGLVGACIPLLAHIPQIDYMLWDNEFLYEVLRAVSICAFLMFFLGYFVYQPEWTLSKKLSLCTTISAALSVALCLIFYQGFPSWGTWGIFSLFRYGTMWLDGRSLIIEFVVTILYGLIWVLFCAGLSSYKGVDRRVRWLAVAVMVSKCVRLAFDEMIVSIISDLLLAALLAFMFALQHKNTKRTEGI
jgi:hypothetical protein